MTKALNATAMPLVADLDAAMAFLKDCLGGETTFRAPFDQGYGQRELHLIHGPVLFMVGQDITQR